MLTESWTVWGREGYRAFCTIFQLSHKSKTVLKKKSTLKMKNKAGVVVHICNSSYSGN
jgi:hypothetical protein